MNQFSLLKILDKINSAKKRINLLIPFFYDKKKEIINFNN